MTKAFKLHQQSISPPLLHLCCLEMKSVKARILTCKSEFLFYLLEEGLEGVTLHYMFCSLIIQTQSVLSEGIVNWNLLIIDVILSDAGSVQMYG